MLSPNAIERVMDEKKVRDHYGVLAGKIKSEILANHPIDELKDPPVPDWVVGLLTEQLVGYRTRIKMVLMHHFDITNDRPSKRFVSDKEMRHSPLQHESQAVKEARMKNKLAAIDYLQKKKQQEKKGK